MTPKVEPTVEKWEWQRVFLDAGTANGCGDLSIMIGTVANILAHSVQEAKAEERKNNFDLFDEILDEAWQDRESAEDPEDPRARVIYLKQELKRYRDKLASLKQEDDKLDTKTLTSKEHSQGVDKDIIAWALKELGWE